MGSSRFWLKAADEESKSIPHELPRSHWLKATGQCVLERYLSATMDLVYVLHFKTVQVNYIVHVQKESILVIHLHYFALKRLLF